MLSRIKEERLPVIAAPVDSRAFSDELNSARSHVLDLISRHLTEFGDKFPAETCQNGFYPLTDNVEWTTSFWTGQLWLAWEMSGEENSARWRKNTCARLACASPGATTPTPTI